MHFGNFIGVLRNKHEVTVRQSLRFVSQKFQFNQLIAECAFCVLPLHTCNFDEEFKSFCQIK